MEDKTVPVSVILVADDDPAVRNLICTMLQFAGYLVLEACNGKEALLLSASFHDNIDLLITDVEMPSMGGVELISKIREQRPELKILVISGEESDKIREASITEPFLKKPFRLDSFLEKVREFLPHRK